MKDLVADQCEAILAALAAASRLGWEVTIEPGRASVLVRAKRTKLYAGAKSTEYDSGIAISRPHVRDALGHLLTVIVMESQAGERVATEARL